MTGQVIKEKPIVVGITQGDINSISYEVIIKSFLDLRMLELMTPVVYGTAKVASYHRKVLNANNFSFNIIRKADQAQLRKANLVNLTDNEIKIDIGKSTSVAGELSLMALEAATEDLKNGLIDVLVTSPINKKNIQSPGFNFHGHTEYLAQKFNAKDYLMLMVAGDLRLGIVSGHVPLKDVASAITTEVILNKIDVLSKSLYYDFGIRRPRIAILGLNPHAGDTGLLGTEEESVIMPAIAKANDKGILAFGPFPADGFFAFGGMKEFDAVLAMYHDQGMIPFKALSYNEGVNFTAGLPVIRTSPAHGTAYDIAGKDIASPDSFRQALYLACDIYRNRSGTMELEANKLGVSIKQSEDNSN
ncbi:MAG: 4-hydroxythreonine-4-phosphate dehydrogenase PdxA [Bacteroidota bacterium]